MTADRIKFLGNPWAAGHAIQDFFWSARLEPSGLWFDLHLQTAEYSAEATGAEDNDASQGDWQATIVWNNYHRCTLSSNDWDGTGFQVASRERPLAFETLSGQEFLVDPLPLAFAVPRAFDIYLLGHDTAADHRLRFTQRSTPNHFSVDWRGRIALSYSGSDEFRYEFEAYVESTAFEGIELPPGIREQDAQVLLAPFVTDVNVFTLAVSGEALRFQLK